MRGSLANMARQRVEHPLRAISPAEHGAVMSYGKFVSELNRGIEGLVIAYDNKPEHGGCVLYLKDGQRKVIIEADVIAHDREEAISLLRAKIRKGEWDGSSMKLCVRDGSLVLDVEELSVAG